MACKFRRWGNGFRLANLKSPSGVIRARIARDGRSIDVSFALKFWFPPGEIVQNTERFGVQMDRDDRLFFYHSLWGNYTEPQSLARFFIEKTGTTDLRGEAGS